MHLYEIKNVRLLPENWKYFKDSDTLARILSDRFFRFWVAFKMV